MPADDVYVTIRFAPETVSRLTRIRTTKGLSRSWIIRAATHEYLDRLFPASPAPPRKELDDDGKNS